MGYLWIGLGGALGAMARVGVMRLLPQLILSLPMKVMLVNIMGCFLIGVIAEAFTLISHVSLNSRHFLIQGFLGGFTTFSAFALEFGLLFEKGSAWLAMMYVIVSVILSLSCFFLGLKLMRYFI